MSKKMLGAFIAIGGFIFVCCLMCAVGFLFGPDNESSTVEVVESIVAKNTTVGPTKEAKEVKAPFEIKTDIEGLSIEVTKITNDDLLEVHVKYKNDTGKLLDLTTSLCKIVADGEQQEYNDAYLDLNSNILYELENGVTYEQIIPFNKIKSNTFNLVFNCNYEDYRVNNIVID